MKNFHKIRQGFSLIELSIVILIVGILIAGVTTSSRLVKRMKITTAQNITQSSPVPSIKDLSVWYETTMDGSLLDIEKSDGTPITIWYDGNLQSSFKYDFKQATLANQPKYSDGIINNLPAIRFDGVDDCMVANSVGFSGKGMTAFLVGQRVAFGGYTRVGMLAGLGPSPQNDDSASGSFVAFADFGTVFTSGTNLRNGPNSPHPGNGTPYIMGDVFTGLTNTMYYNGSPSTEISQVTSFLVDSLRVGCNYFNTNTAFHNGFIAEIIIYSRGLNTEERKSVEAYLSKKYAIKLL